MREKAQPEIVEEMKPKRHLLIRYLFIFFLLSSLYSSLSDTK